MAATNESRAFHLTERFLHAEHVRGSRIKLLVEAALAARRIFLTADNANFHLQNNLIVATEFQER